MLFLLLIGIVTVQAAQLIGKGEAASESVRVFHLAECQLPCWAGITLGQTTSDAGEARLRELFGASGFRPLFDSGGSGGSAVFGTELAVNTPPDEAPNVYVGFGAQQGVVEQIVFRFGDASAIRLGEVAALYGTPTCWDAPIIAPGEDTLVYLRPNMTILIGVDKRSLDAKVRALFIESGTNPFRCLDSGRVWNGFNNRSTLR